MNFIALAIAWLGALLAHSAEFGHGEDVQNDLLVTPPPSTVISGPSRGPRAPRASKITAEDKAASPRLLPRRLGRYLLFDHIGRGGMADIYLAKAETELGGSRLVVIKEVLPLYAEVPAFAEMLAAEARLAAKLTHANVVKVEDLGREDEHLYIAMEYVEGLDMREVLRGAAKRKIPVPIEFSLRVVMETLKALDYAHRARDEEGKRLGVIHCDVSPSNVLVSFEGEVKICDFGIARAGVLAPVATSEEAIAGKAGYMSPEQARGDALDARADVFAAGVMLWEMLAGRRLYKAREGERLLDVARRAEIPELPRRGIPHEDELARVIMRALEVDRDARYASAAAMLQDLEEYAIRARLFASPLRFGEWLMEHFGAQVLRRRRTRELVLRALERGPAVVLEPISSPSSSSQTPTHFPVVAPRDEEPADVAPQAALARESTLPLSRGTSNRSFALAFVLAALFFSALWLIALR